MAKNSLPDPRKSIMPDGTQERASAAEQAPHAGLPTGEASANESGLALRVSNWRYAGPRWFWGLIFTPAVTVASIAVPCIVMSQALRADQEPDWVAWVFGAIGLIPCLPVCALIAHYVCSNMPWWIEIGDQLRYRRLWGVSTRRWPEVRQVEFQDEASVFGVKIPGAIRTRSHRILAISLRDGGRLRVEITAREEVQIGVMLAHLKTLGVHMPDPGLGGKPPHEMSIRREEGTRGGRSEGAILRAVSQDEGGT